MHEDPDVGVAHRWTDAGAAGGVPLDGLLGRREPIGTELGRVLPIAGRQRDRHADGNRIASR
jgi:hypothetical protein